jgi:hypothetical protein
MSLKNDTMHKAKDQIELSFFCKFGAENKSRVTNRAIFVVKSRLDIYNIFSIFTLDLINRISNIPLSKCNTAFLVYFYVYIFYQLCQNLG